MNKNITVREYREGDEVSIMKLRGLIFGNAKSMDWWIWQRELNPAGRAIITVAEDTDKNEVIGQLCYLPLRVKVGIDIHKFASSVDGMIHPDYRGLGIYPEMIKAAWDSARKHSIKYSCNFLSELTTRIGKGTGSIPIFKKVPLWIKPLNYNRISANYFKKDNILTHSVSVVGRGIIRIIDKSRNYKIQTQVREVKEIDERFDSLWQQASSLYKVMIVRDKLYLAWRYTKRPDANYTIYVSEQDGQLLGYIVLRSIKDNGFSNGWIADILVTSCNTPAAMDLITMAIQYFIAKDIDIIRCIMPPRIYLARILKNQGFLLMSKWTNREIAIRIRELTESNLKPSLLSSENWYLTRGDSDLI
jgi:GNAT superfamily N-acetyltransferase